MKKIPKTVCISIIVFVLAVIGVFVIMYFNEIRTLASLKRVNELDMFSIDYYCDDYFGEFLEAGGAQEADESGTIYQICTNFNLYGGERIGTGIERYETIEERLIENHGVLTETQALELLRFSQR